MNLIEHLTRQREFSLRTFGPGPRAEGVCNHIEKEIDEVRKAPDDISEWIDIVILGFDGAMRQGFTPEQIAAALEAKQTKNENRKWPDWRTVPVDQAIEHVRDEALTFPAPSCDWGTLRLGGANLILNERQRQIEEEGFDAEHDQQHSAEEIRTAASCYLLATGPDDPPPAEWPWSPTWWKPKDKLRNLIRAGALYLAAADREERDGTQSWRDLEVTRLRGQACAVARLIDDELRGELKQ